MFDYFKFKIRRTLRKMRRSWRRLRVASVDYFDRHVWGKWQQLGIIRRLVIIWWGIIAIAVVGLMNQVGALRGHYLEPAPTTGGRYVEGLVGSVQLINPILPESGSASDISRLVFNGLTRYTPERKLEGDLATDWLISPDGKTYTFKLRRDVKWHDGVPFSAQDVVFTLTAIQNPDTRSPLAASWQGVKAEAKDEHTVEFVLSKPFTPFINSTTVGILPRHKLETTDPASLRALDFNQAPVGTGPFKIKDFIESEQAVHLEANERYYAGRPSLDEFVFRWFDNTDQAMEAYAKRQITAISGLPPVAHQAASKLANLRLLHYSLPNQTNLFFRNTAPILKDKTVRSALQMATDRGAIIDQTTGGQALDIGLPILPGQIGYAASQQPSGYDLAKAKAHLEEAGWKIGQNGRFKDGQKLKLKLVTLTSNEYHQVAELIQEQWSDLGVEVEIITTDLTNLQQSYIRPRNYDLLLFGLNVGADPDVYAYWHSSQVDDPGLNLSQYQSTVADKALESARVLPDAATRAAKYQAFLAAWRDDFPAIVLYSPSYTYAISGNVTGPRAGKLVDPSDRFYGVEKWAVEYQLIPKINR